MLKYKINIIELEPLYLILLEIKDKLNFEIKNFKQFSDFLKEFENNQEQDKDFLIITDLKIQESLLKIRKLNSNDVIFFAEKDKKIKNFLNFPININNLIEKINIKLIKKKYQEQAKISLLNYRLDINSRIIFNNQNKLKLTEREVDIILFLKNKKSSQTVSQLQGAVWGYSSELETHTVETHIHRLRKKIKENFKDTSFVISKNNGYFIE